MATSIVPPPRVGDGNKAGVSFAGCAHFLKLRQNFKASERFRVEMGLDYDIKKSETKPWAGVRLQASISGPLHLHLHLHVTLTQHPAPAAHCALPAAGRQARQLGGRDQHRLGAPVQPDY
jgi:hypothetical protein